MCFTVSKEAIEKYAKRFFDSKPASEELRNSFINGLESFTTSEPDTSLEKALEELPCEIRD